MPASFPNKVLAKNLLQDFSISKIDPVSTIPSTQQQSESSEEYNST
jgi:hypothetical protein